MAEEQGIETVHCTVNGMAVEVPKGTRMIDAAAHVGSDVPHYCYHPGLSAPAQCRLCLVEVEGSPKLLPACVTVVQEGNVIRTESEAALEARKAVLEFLLVNHPLDCPVCDQSGECKLQDYVSAEGPAMGRLADAKRIVGVDDFGGDVLFNGDRCVMCTRCVRFMREVAQDERLGVVQRGSRAVIDTFFDDGLDGNIWADNVVDICPVGALVSKDFLHRARAWDLDRTPSICPNCSQGCNITLQVRDNEVMRLKPRPNDAVNGHWMCDVGRLDYQWINRKGRIEAPLVREGDRFVPMSWSDTLPRLVDAVRALSSQRGGAVVSPFLSNEDLGAARRVMEAVGGGRSVYRVETGESVVLPGFPQLALREDRAANVRGSQLFGFERVGDGCATGGLEAVDNAEFLLVAGDDLEDAPADFGSGARLFIYIGQLLNPAARNAHFVLPATTFAEMEGTFTNVNDHVQRFWPALRPPGMARPVWQILGVLLSGLNGSPAPARPADAFALLGAARPEFGQLRFEDLGATGNPLSGAATAPAGS
ncbi:MAG: (2Fe-2S)-binding protein [Gemmatimonadota bacterium]|jgi:NADH-quinone oxidoreductase subunit G|nr:(2Fe-2S)-binding protein [Gemmatimonadota bacterium]